MDGGSRRWRPDRCRGLAARLPPPARRGRRRLGARCRQRTDAGPACAGGCHIHRPAALPDGRPLAARYRERLGAVARTAWRSGSARWDSSIELIPFRTTSDVSSSRARAGIRVRIPATILGVPAGSSTWPAPDSMRMSSSGSPPGSPSDSPTWRARAAGTGPRYRAATFRLTADDGPAPPDHGQAVAGLRRQRSLLRRRHADCAEPRGRMTARWTWSPSDDAGLRRVLPKLAKLYLGNLLARPIGTAQTRDPGTHRCRIQLREGSRRTAIAWAEPRRCSRWNAGRCEPARTVNTGGVGV